MTEGVPVPAPRRTPAWRRVLRSVVITAAWTLLFLVVLAVGGAWYFLRQTDALSPDPRPSREHAVEVARDVALEIPPSAAAEGLWVQGMRDHTIYILLTVPRAEVGGFVGQKLLRGKLQPGSEPQVPREVRKRWPGSATAAPATWQSFSGPVPYQRRPQEQWWLSVDVQGGDTAEAIIYVVVSQT